jgi:hypothetical protein
VDIDIGLRREIDARHHDQRSCRDDLDPARARLRRI